MPISRVCTALLVASLAAGCSEDPQAAAPTEGSGGTAGPGGTAGAGGDTGGGAGGATGTGGAGGSGAGGSGAGGSGAGGSGAGGSGAGGAAPFCGDGDAGVGEACDGDDIAGQSCAGLGFVGGALGCTAGCALDTSLCHDCGNGAVDPGEACDGAALNGGTCVSLGFDLGSLACTSGCTYDASACAYVSCGDGMMNGAEECDGADLGGASCVSLGFDGGALACAPSCSYSTASCFACGDGVKNGAEACDGADLGATSCAALGFDGGALGCTGACSLETTGCFACGDGATNGSEQCDGADLAGASCVTLGFVSGDLGCGPTCEWDPSQCLTACDLNAPPAVTLPATLVVEPYLPFTLHATLADDDPIGSLTITWSGGPGAPPLSGATTADPSGTAADCGEVEYTITVTDPCGSAASATVTVIVPGTGPHVSRSTCTPGHECGSIQHPWCTIQKGVNETESPALMVAGSATPYIESVLIAGAVDILGGYEPTFTLPRNPDPATNQTTVESSTSAFTWGWQAAAVVDGFNVVPTMPSASASQRAVFSVAGNASATLAHVRIHPSVGSPRYSTEYGVRVGDQDGGSLLVQDSILQSPRPTYKSVALSVHPATDAAVTLVQSSALAAAPSSSSGISIGIEQEGAGVLSVQGGIIKAGLAETTSGVRAPQVASPAARQITLDGVAVEGNLGRFAHGIQVVGAGALWIHGGSVLGKGSNASSTTAAGVAADSVGYVELDGVTVAGTDAIVGLGETVSAHGLKLSNAQNVAGASASVIDSDILGGSVGQHRRGILSEGVPLEIQGSTIAGSRTGVVYGSTKGATSVVGVELTGTFPPATTVHLHDNLEILGGDVQAPCNNYQCGAAAIRVNALLDSVIEGNTTIRGAYAASGFATDGIRINQGGTHVISQNGTIEAGGQLSSGWYVFAGIKVVSVGDNTVTNVTVQGNTLIAGNAFTGFADTPVGFYGAGVNATIADNDRILGGYGYYGRGIQIERSSASPSGGLYSNVVNAVNIHGNAIDGGTRSATGLRAVYTTGTVTDNVIRACGIEVNGQPAANCVVAGTSVGLAVEADLGTLVANNYVFGGYTSTTTACRLGCVTQGGCNLRLATTFLHNTCAATQQPYPNTQTATYALHLAEPDPADCPVIANNILDASGATSGVYSFFHLDPLANGPPEDCYQFFNNDLVPRNLACAAYVLFPGTVCYPSAAALNAKGNAVQQIANNVDLSPGYVAEDILHPTAAGYHLDATCALDGLGLPYASVPADHDGDPRDPAQPAIGADECP